MPETNFSTSATNNTNVDSAFLCLVYQVIKPCLDRLDRKRAEGVMRDLIARLKTAEREGRSEDVQSINLQVNELRMRKAGTPVAGTVSLVKE